MGLTGNLRTMDLPEILQWISMGRKTGTLHLDRGSIEKRIVFRDGVVYTSWSNDPRESLGQYLIRQRRLTEEQLFTAMLRQEQQGCPWERPHRGGPARARTSCAGLLEPRPQETIYDLFLWPEGRFEFVDGEIQEDVQVFLDIAGHRAWCWRARAASTSGSASARSIPSAHTTFTAARGAGVRCAGAPEAQALRAGRGRARRWPRSPGAAAHRVRGGQPALRPLLRPGLVAVRPGQGRRPAAPTRWGPSRSC